MKIEVKVEKLPTTKEDTDVYQVEIKSYNQCFKAKLEKSELRHLIQKLDNPIV